jgi:hypothetical protein
MGLLGGVTCDAVSAYVTTGSSKRNSRWTRGNVAAVRAPALLATALAFAIAGLGCGEEDEFTGSPDPATERNDPPAKPPPGWHTFANRRAGFTLSVPPGWPARARQSATLIRSTVCWR